MRKEEEGEVFLEGLESREMGERERRKKTSLVHNLQVLFRLFALIPPPPPTFNSFFSFHQPCASSPRWLWSPRWLRSELQASLFFF